ncbi:MAG: PE-PPE domain-containing protein [Mycobacterium sp.]|uniref:PE-PPE domain-containing protein n=1 Tax=Mycobacterium sp. TaxID=1785 RepID=UPI003CC52A91
MAGRRLRWLGAGMLASGGAGLLALTSSMNAAFAYGAADTALIMGGSFNPEPDPVVYVPDVNTDYIQPLYHGFDSVGLYTPEQFFPVSGFSALTFDQSVAQGVTDLNNAITLPPVAGGYAGDNLVVFGYSQSATTATDEMNNLAAAGNPMNPGQLAFILVGDPNNPDGGILERFVGASIPILGVSFNGATPPDTPYPTDIYTIQYDGVADAPQYPLNITADLNALLGYFYLHSDYPTVPVSDYTVTLPTSPGYYPDGETHYFEMLTQNLPLLDPVRDIPVVGNPLADLMQPDLRVIVDLGYGDGYANVPTPAGLFPLVNPLTVGSELVTGAQQGFTAALVDLGILPSTDLSGFAYPYLPVAETPGEIQLPGLLSGLSDPSTGVSSLFSTDVLGSLDSQLTSLLSDLDLSNSLLSLPDAFGLALDPATLLSAFDFLSL